MSTDADGSKDQEKKTLPFWVEMPIIILVTLLILGAFNTFIGRMYLIPSASMEPTLHGCAGCVPDRIYVNKLAYIGDSKPEPGEVVVFTGPPSWNSVYQSVRSDNSLIRGLQNAGAKIGVVAPDENTVVKRVIATGGQVVQCREGDPGIMVDGKRIDDSYTLPAPKQAQEASRARQAGYSAACQGAYFGPVKVPDNSLWVMGDNRYNSSDSRYHLVDEFQGTIPLDNVVGRVEAIIWPPSRIGRVESVELN